MKRFLKRLDLFAFLLIAPAMWAQTDLRIEEVEVLQPEVFPGDTITVRVAYANDGASATASGFSIQLILFNPDGVEMPSAQQTVGALGPGVSAEIQLAYAVPADAENGIYRVEATVDADDDVGEIDEGNNVSSTSFEIDTVPDLVIADLYYESGRWEAGDLIDFSIVVGSESFTPAPDFNPTRGVLAHEVYQFEVVLSTDLVFGNEDDFLLYETAVAGNGSGGPLLPGEMYVVEWAQAIPRNFRGDYFVLAKVDVAEEIAEAIEGNSRWNGNNIWYPRETAKISITTSANPEPTTFRASLKSDGSSGSALSESPSLSADGRYVAFSSLSQLADGDADNYFDIYRRDNLSGDVILVSRSRSMPTSTGDSTEPSISGNGRYVVFTSESSNLVAGDTNRHRDIFRADLLTGEIILVSRASGAAGTWSNSASASPQVSEDGNYVVFQSTATNLTGDSVNGRLNVLLRDIAAGTTRLLTPGTDGPSNGDSFEPRISADGQFVTFTSRASDLVAAGVGQQIYRVGADGSGMTLVSRSAAGAAGNASSFEPAISGDGSVIAYATLATNIAPPPGGDDDTFAEIVIAEVSADSVVPSRLLGADGSSQFNNPSEEWAPMVGARQPSISANGNRVTFRTQSNNLLPTTVIRSDGAVWTQGSSLFSVGYEDRNSTSTTSTAVSDIYLFDRATGEYALASVNRFGYQGAMVRLSVNGDPAYPNVPSARDAVISGDGRYVAFSSDGRHAFGLEHERSNRVSGDDNEVRDVFVHDFRTTASMVPANPPTVSIVSPAGGTEVSTRSGTVVRATATASPEPGGPVGTIAQVEFFANGQSIGVRDTPPYEVTFIPDREGEWEISAVATSSTGLRSTPVGVRIEAFEGSLPQVISFTHDATDNRGRVGTPINFTIEAADEEGVDRVELLLADNVVGSAAGSSGTIRYEPTAPGIYRFQARAVNLDGRGAVHGPITIQIAAPDPLASAEDFVRQIYRDMLMRSPSAAEQSSAVATFDPEQAASEQTAALLVVTGILDRVEFEMVRAATFSRYLLTDQWPTRAQLENDVQIITHRAGGAFTDATTVEMKASALVGLVQSLLPTFEQRYPALAGVPEGTPLPSSASPESDIVRFVSVLWEEKYGEAPQDTGTLVSRMRMFGRDAFVARFILDTDVVVSPNGQAITPILGIRNPPNDRAYDWSNSAALILSLIKVQPSHDEVVTLALRQPYDQVTSLMLDPRYAARFATAFPTLEHREPGYGWKYSDWFGWFQTTESAWNYSLELGWVYFQLEGQSDSSFWYYDPGTHWSWTMSGVFPHIYSHGEGSWLLSARLPYAPGESRWFYSYGVEPGWVLR